MAMIAITIISSIRVNPRAFVFMAIPLDRSWKVGGREGRSGRKKEAPRCGASRFASLRFAGTNRFKPGSTALGRRVLGRDRTRNDRGQATIGRGLVGDRRATPVDRAGGGRIREEDRVVARGDRVRRERDRLLVH